jgi:nucleoside-diphosphate-sugar epimerase
MKILLTGATGFLGSHLLEGLLSVGSDVIVLKRSFSDMWRIKDVAEKITCYDLDKCALEKVFYHNKIDIIIHVATDYGRDSHNLENMLGVNLVLPTNLLELAVKNGVKCFVNTDTSTCSTYTLYSSMKKAFVEMGKFYAANYDISFVNLIVEYIYGYGDDESKFIPILINAILEGKELKASPGEQRRDFIYISDVVSAYIKLINVIDKFESGYWEFHIGSGKSISLKEFASVVEKVSGKKAKVRWGVLPYRKNEIMELKTDIRLAKTLLSWEPKYDLITGLKKMIKGKRDR